MNHIVDDPMLQSENPNKLWVFQDRPNDGTAPSGMLTTFKVGNAVKWVDRLKAETRSCGVRTRSWMKKAAISELCPTI